MKLNAKGWKIFDKWDGIYADELERLRKEKNDSDYIEGWCIIDDDDHVKTIDDAIGISIFGDDDYAIYHIMDCVEVYHYFESPDEEWRCGISCREMVKLLTPYFDFDEDDDITWKDKKDKGENNNV